MNISDFIQFERKVGSPIYQQNDRTIRPISRTLSMWWQPYGGSVRNFPVAVQVEENGTIREEPIIDVTLWIGAGITLLTILSTLLIWTLGQNQK